MATVYLAEDVRHRRRVAIKLLHPELSAVLGPDRFLKEIELTANLQHPHILPLFDSGAVDGLLYYVMPFVEGETLRSRLSREHQPPIAEAVRIASDVAGALEYAHQRGVVHRDIKPENILLHAGRRQGAAGVLRREGDPEVGPVESEYCLSFRMNSRDGMSARRVPQGSPEAGDAIVEGSVDERLALVSKLSLSAWANSGRPLPDYIRTAMPIHRTTLRARRDRD